MSGKCHIDAVDEDGNTALIHAAYNGHQLIIAQLLASGANTNIQSKDGYTALIHSSFNGDKAIVEMLIAAGANRGKDRGYC